LDEAVILAIQCLAKVVEGKLEPSKLRIVVIPADTKKFRRLSEEELDKYIKRSDVTKKPAGK
ncbi:MAG TPA: proteasome subunit alpha, partial [archaeon]|nr:proteasome subunit alpha [archaeon]